MSPGEIGWRLREFVGSIAERRLATRARESHAHSEPRRGNLVALRQGRRALFPELAEPGSLQEALKPHKEHLVREADSILGGQVLLFRNRPVFVGDKPNWNYDYVQRKEIESAFYRDLNSRDPETFGNARAIWELNRHYHIVQLSLAFFLTNCEQYADRAIAHIASWIGGNPYLYGANWTSPLESGIRLISWAAASCFLCDSKSWTSEFQGRVEASIEEHIKFVIRHRSRGSSANNHLIGEMAGVLVAGCVYGHLERAQQWREIAFGVLVREAEKQVHADGVGKEQAVSYQIFVGEFLLIGGLLAMRSGLEVMASYWERLERMLEFMAAILDERGSYPRIGDSDDAQVLGLDPQEHPMKPLLDVGTVLFERDEFSYGSSETSIHALCLLEARQAPVLGATTTRVNRGRPLPRCFPDGGYYILGAFRPDQRGIRVIVDCGPLGFGSLAAHGHADALQILLSVDGVQFFVDPGTYVYHTDDVWRRYFKSTAAHNTLEIEGRDQSEYQGPFLWGAKAKSHTVLWESAPGEDRIVCSHDGYTRLSDPLIHNRSVLVKDRSQIALVRDWVSNGDQACRRRVVPKRVGACLCFHLDPACDVIQVDARSFLLRNAGRELDLEFDIRIESVELLRGGTNRGWYSPSFLEKVPTSSLFARGKVPIGAVLETRITLKRDASG